jgi:hypothetical protein
VERFGLDNRRADGYAKCADATGNHRVRGLVDCGIRHDLRGDNESVGGASGWRFGLHHSWTHNPGLCHQERAVALEHAAPISQR